MSRELKKESRFPQKLDGWMGYVRLAKTLLIALKLA